MKVLICYMLYYNNQLYMSVQLHKIYMPVTETQMKKQQSMPIVRVVKHVTTNDSVCVSLCSYLGWAELSKDLELIF